MSILSQQLSISQRAFTNDIITNPEAQSLTYRSGYYGNGGQYPDAREFFDSDSTVEDIKESETAPDLSNLEVLMSNADRMKILLAHTELSEFYDDE